jgi:phospholipid transport system substrate-binding protein
MGFMQVSRFVPFVFALGLVLAAPTPRAAAAPANPASFMTEVSGQVLHLLSDQQTPEPEREKNFEALVDQNFDMPRIARFVLGTSWRGASEDERKRFAEAFRTYMINFYWGRFQQYAGQSFKVIGQQPQSGTVTVVNTQIVQPSGQPPAKVNWTVVKESDAYKIIDVSIEGISQVLTYRQEFAAVIQRNDGHVSALIDEINKKIKG